MLKLKRYNCTEVNNNNNNVMGVCECDVRMMRVAITFFSSSVLRQRVCEIEIVLAAIPFSEVVDPLIAENALTL